MNYLDYNDADRQQGELIPDGTVVPLSMTIRPGGVGDGGWLTASKSSDAVMLNCEFTVTEGAYVRRKIFQNLVVSGGRQDEKGNSIAGNISRQTLRAILESARNVKPEDMSEAAVAKRRIGGWNDFCGIVCLVKVGIEKGKDGYADKNRIKTVITPDMKEYAPVSALSAQATPAAPPASAPAWGTAPPPPQAVPQGNNPAPSWAR